MLRKKDQSEISMKCQPNFMHSNVLGKKGQSAGWNCINCYSTIHDSTEHLQMTVSAENEHVGRRPRTGKVNATDFTKPTVTWDLFEVQMSTKVLENSRQFLGKFYTIFK